MKFLSVCSGIEAASVAWEPLGFEPLAFSEIEPFPSAVLAHHWPTVPNLGDFTTIERSSLPALPDVLIGGTPCQAFSVAGLRNSLDDDRGNLTLEFIRLADRLDDGNLVVVWENVPGVLSTKDNAFGAFLGGLVGADTALVPPNGKRWGNAGLVDGPTRRAAYRILDAQYFGVAQRRRRVFVVASARADFDPAAVLFEPESVPRHTPPSREPREGAAAGAEAGAGSGRFYEHHQIDSRVTGPHEVSTTCAARLGTGGGNTPIVTEPQAFRKSARVQASWWDGGNLAATVTTKSNQQRMPDKGNFQAVVEPPIVLDRAAYHQGANAQYEPYIEPSDTTPTLTASGPHAVMPSSAVRRLTPVECERLQGFPDNHTRIEWRNKPAEDCPDSHRYKACGNSMAVPVIAWIGRRIVAQS